MIGVKMDLDEINFLRLGQRIRAIREDRKLTQQQLAEQSGLHRTFIRAVEPGGTQSVVAQSAYHLQGVASSARGAFCGEVGLRFRRSKAIFRLLAVERRRPPL